MSTLYPVHNLPGVHFLRIEENEVIEALVITNTLQTVIEGVNRRACGGETQGLESRPNHHTG